MARDFKNYRDISRTSWGTSEEISPDHIMLGAVLRIADAVEKMAESWVRLTTDRDQWKRTAENRSARIAELERSNRALRGVVTKLRSRMPAEDSADTSTTPVGG